jgi:Uri superfamily endonuclease
MTKSPRQAEPALPPSGVYRLTIRLARPAVIRVGRLGVFRFPAGQYVYCGSAQRNLPARVARHRRKRKPKRWHIDYLTTHPAATVIAVEAVSAGKIGECELAQAARAAGGAVIAAGFGASDCASRPPCTAHLVYWE